jgi:hypothetical protein
VIPASSLDDIMMNQGKPLGRVTQARRIGDLMERRSRCDQAVEQPVGEGPHHRRTARHQSHSDFARLSARWRLRCSIRAATAIANAGRETVADIEAVGALGFLAMPTFKGGTGCVEEAVIVDRGFIVRGFIVPSFDEALDLRDTLTHVLAECAIPLQWPLRAFGERHERTARRGRWADSAASAASAPGAGRDRQRGCDTTSPKSMA